MTTLYCAVCGHRFEPDDDHVWLDAETRKIDDRNQTDSYAMHPTCWDRVSGGWGDPA